MSNPNLAAMAGYYLDNVHGSIASSANATLVANAAASGEVLEVYSAIFTNIDSTAPVEFTLSKVSTSGVAEISKTISIPVKAAEALIQKDWPVVLKEGECLCRQAGVGGDSAYNVSFRRYS
jgi:hypothetical protein